MSIQAPEQIAFQALGTLADARIDGRSVHLIVARAIEADRAQWPVPPRDAALRTLRAEALGAVVEIKESRDASDMDDVFNARDRADAVLHRLIEMTKGI